VLATCPMAPWTHDKGKDSNPSFAVRDEPGDARTNCFSCAYRGSLSELVLEIRHRNKTQPRIENAPWGQLLAKIEEAEMSAELDFDSPDIEEVLFGEKKELHEFPDWWMESFPRALDIPWARKYLADRNVPEEISEAVDLRADTEERRVCFPVRDFQGIARGLHGRAVDKETEPRYRMYTQAGKNNPIVWLGENWIDLSEPILVVEGPFDLLSAARVYPNVVSPLFANPGFEKIRRMGDALEWITLLDRGKAGDIGRHRIQEALHEDHVITHLMPPEGVKDPGEMTAHQLAELLSPLVKLIADFLD